MVEGYYKLAILLSQVFPQPLVCVLEPLFCNQNYNECSMHCLGICKFAWCFFFGFLCKYCFHMVTIILELLALMSTSYEYLVL
jgi:hypothetical protein